MVPLQTLYKILGITEQDIQLAELYLLDGVAPDEVARQFSTEIRKEVMFDACWRAYKSDPVKFAHLYHR